MELYDRIIDYGAQEQEREAEKKRLEKERKLQEAMLTVKKKYGKNAILKGTNLQEGATTIERNLNYFSLYDTIFIGTYVLKL